MATASTAFKNLMGAAAQLASTSTTALVAADNLVQYLGSYAQELRDERIVEAAINAADREERIIAEKAMTLVEAQEAILGWLGNNQVRQTMYQQQLEALKQRLHK